MASHAALVHSQDARQEWLFFIINIQQWQPPTEHFLLTHSGFALSRSLRDKDGVDAILTAIRSGYPITTYVLRRMHRVLDVVTKRLTTY